MSEVHAVVGYLPDAAAKAAAQGQLKDALQVRLEQGSDEMHVKINYADVLGVLTGASAKGETSVQVLLKPGAKVDTVSRGAAADLFLRPIRDLNLFPFRVPINRIFIDPQLVQKLIGLQQG